MPSRERIIETLRARRALCLGLISAALAVVACPAQADERANAETLFQLGKAAMVRKDYPAACRYFEESLKLEDALGTLLNAAACHEEVGRVGTAWGEYRAVEQRALRASPPQQDRATAAHARAEVLHPRLSRVVITVPEAARLEGLEVRVDGSVAPPALWDVGLVVDPGKRHVSVSAPGHKLWSTITAVDDEGISVTVTIPALEVEARKAAPAPVGGVDAATLEAMSANRARRVVGYVVGGVGIASLGLGATMGVFAITKSDEARCGSPCPATLPDGSNNPKLQAAKDAHKNTLVFANVANVAIGAGLAAMGVGTLLVLTAPSVARPPRSAWSVGPWVSDHQRGLSAQGTF